MRQTVIIALALFLGCATGAAVRDIVVPARAQNAIGPVYDYQVHKLEGSDDLGPVLTRFGAQGWRAVQVAHSTSHNSPDLLIFERSRPAAAPAASTGPHN